MESQFFVWDISPHIIKIGFFELRYYSLMFLIGFTAGYFIVKRMFIAEGKNTEILGSLLNYLILGTIIGARLGHCLFYQPDYYLQHPLEILMVWKGGLASHGGFLGVCIAIYLFVRKHNMAWLYLTDRIGVPTILVAGLIRLGNLFNSEIIGRPSEVPWAIIFKQVDNVPRHPSQLYEALSYFSIFGLSFFLFWKTNLKQTPGRITGGILALGFTARLLIEYLKENQVEFEQGMFMNMGQLLSVPFIIYGLWLFLRPSSSTSEPDTDESIDEKKQRRKLRKKFANKVP